MKPKPRANVSGPLTLKTPSPIPGGCPEIWGLTCEMWGARTIQPCTWQSCMDAQEVLHCLLAGLLSFAHPTDTVFGPYSFLSPLSSLYHWCRPWNYAGLGSPQPWSLFTRELAHAIHISHSRDMDVASSSHDITAKLIATLPGGNPGAVSLGFRVVGACHHQDLAMGPWGDLEAVINSWNSWILTLTPQAKETGCWSHGWAIYGTVEFYNLEGSVKLIREIFLPSAGVLLITIQGLRTI